MIKNHLVNVIENTKIRHLPKSDHDLIEIITKTNSCNRGPGYWKLNNSYINDKDFQRGIKNVIEECKTVSPFELNY